MARDGRPTKLQVDSDGVRTERAGVRPGVWVAALAIVLIGVALLVRVRPTPYRGVEQTMASHVAAPQGADKPPKPGGVAVHPVPVAVKVQPPSDAAPAVPVRLVPKGPPELAPPVADLPAVPPAEPVQAPPNDEAAPANETAEDHSTGIALFPPPGTKPILRGIVVPEDFPLPEGYVRHYQTTDEGKQLPAVLMFHPDYELLDAQGQPFPMPEDRLVPPELVPAGMPVQTLEVPEEQGPPPPALRSDGEQDTAP